MACKFHTPPYSYTLARIRENQLQGIGNTITTLYLAIKMLSLCDLKKVFKNLSSYLHVVLSDGQQTCLPAVRSTIIKYSST